MNRFVKVFQPVLFGALAIACSAAWGANTKTLTLDTQGIKSLRVSAGAGPLRVEGTSGRVIEAIAEIDGDERDIRFTLERSGDAAQLVAETESVLFNWFGLNTRLQVRVKVPTGLALQIEDGSGDIRIEGVTGNTRVEDGSGALTIRSHRGNLEVHDGSGSIHISGVNGDVEVHDGSGSIEIVNIEGHVTIEDGSGAIDVENVKRGLTILDSGSGSVRMRNVEGPVDRR